MFLLKVTEQENIKNFVIKRFEYDKESIRCFIEIILCIIKKDKKEFIIRRYGRKVTITAPFDTFNVKIFHDRISKVENHINPTIFYEFHDRKYIKGGDNYIQYQDIFVVLNPDIIHTDAEIGNYLPEEYKDYKYAIN